MFSAADARGVFAAVGYDLAAGDGDVAAVAHAAAADARAIFAAIGRDLAAGDGDVAAITADTAADARSVFAAVGCYLAAGDGNVAAIASVAAADARGGVAARGGQTAVIVRIGDGQAAGVVLLQTGAATAALDRVRALQFDGHIAIAPRWTRRLVLCRSRRCSRPSA